ncbi:chaperone modulator CbpM [Legionella sp. PATHC032]|uniref:chaperone modulator CbpM n=1 Tax=Legionella sp. PATHC032 TaxID=2992039 RepID=UPI001B26C75E|nr:chaperone modulator CbpM [Legionella sp. PATHC032]MCW8422220.1 chaperone modulator CbpM [Legionella sp. PATHC032]HAZ7572691.1 molecular chaperone [Legionella pneumophila]HBA1634934.1 molecular chaperone [Legionella pneumophila]
MSKDNLLIGMLIEETTTISFIEVCQKYHIPEELFIEMIEQGLFPDQPSDPQKIALGQKELRRLESAFRLHRDLGINLPGVALALDLLEKIDHMHHELEILRKHF